MKFFAVIIMDMCSMVTGTMGAKQLMHRNQSIRPWNSGCCAIGILIHQRQDGDDCIDADAILRSLTVSYAGGNCANYDEFRKNTRNAGDKTDVR